ncbi:Gfo/Idh/MocA family oxidoreductase [Coraliomargarita sp. SDUM461003]|uniref:Gfo/Idh/MocA family oxidoreductase n=2 Tax=Thalassobacterium maritimum TaxID=3041265 RepID=A0ABU1AWD1_9BACT|nr:Gfo/Idh/MocA family oxidoreductase [Coraliomargarita sp. SDUM461003]
MPSRALRVALVGLSGFAKVHYQMIQRAVACDRICLLGATVINQEDELEKCECIRAAGGDIFDDYEKMFRALNGQLDLCFIPTGIHLHARMAIAAMEAGANVFLEKPAAATIQDVRAIQATERKTGRFVAVGFQTIYASETLWMKQAILDGRIGKIRSIRSMGLWPRDDAYYARNDWAGRLLVGQDWMLDSPFNNAIGHQLNMMCFLGGITVEKSAELAGIRAELYRAHSIESADTACMRIETTTGLPLYFYATHSSSTQVDPEIIIDGELGSIHWTFTEVALSTDQGEETILACQFGDELREVIIERLLARSVDDSVFICDLEIAAAHTICVNGAHESSEVHNIPPDFIQRLADESGSVKTVVVGLDQSLTQAFQQGKLLSEIGVKWAVPGQYIDLSDYSYFPRFRQFECWEGSKTEPEIEVVR